MMQDIPSGYSMVDFKYHREVGSTRILMVEHRTCHCEGATRRGNLGECQSRIDISLDRHG